MTPQMSVSTFTQPLNLFGVIPHKLLELEAIVTIKENQNKQTPQIAPAYPESCFTNKNSAS